MNVMTRGLLRVPGASLYYKVRGSGPLLLVLPSGSGDADSADLLIDRLVDRYTVVAYDRRGMTRSPLEDPTRPPRLETHGEDAHRLLAELTAEPAMVFGCSTGGMIGLELVLRHPAQVRTLVAHEPPALSLLAPQERAEVLRRHGEVELLLRTAGWRAALRRFYDELASDLTDREPEVPLRRPNSRTIANVRFFLAHDSGATARYVLGPAERVLLRASATRIVPAAGTSSAGSLPHRCIAALAEALDTPLTAFPGGHEGYLTHPTAFAARLTELLT